MNPFTQTAIHYPIHSHHMIVKNAIDETIVNMKAPDALIAASFMTTMVVACQGLVDVLLPTGQKAPTTQNILVLADSGERKTAVDRRVAAPILAFDERLTAAHTAAKVKYEAALLVWKVENAALSLELAKAIRYEKPHDDIKHRLQTHAEQRPAKPKHRRLMRQNATARAVMDALDGDGESVAFLSSEGHVVLNGGIANQLGLLNSAWDGPGMLVLDRAKGVEVIARNPRLSIGLMVQPEIWKIYQEKLGEVARSSGLFARFLFAWPGSTQGMRQVWTLDMSWSHLDVFHQRVNELLNEFGRRVDSGSITRDVLEFSPEAKSLWLDLQNMVEVMLKPHGYLDSITDFGSKIMEISGRLAATMHYFARQEGQISVDTLNRSAAIVGWHLGEFKRIFAPAPAVNQLLIDAQALDQFLSTNHFSRNQYSVRKNDVLQYGPLRTKARLDPAIDHLQSIGRIWIGHDQRKRRYINQGIRPNQARSAYNSF